MVFRDYLYALSKYLQSLFYLLQQKKSKYIEHPLKEAFLCLFLE